jgi:hypothetical protein
MNLKKDFTFLLYGLLGVDGSREAVGNVQEVVEDEVDR